MVFTCENCIPKKVKEKAGQGASNGVYLPPMASLNNSISVKLRRDQRLALDYLGERNFDTKPTKLIRISLDILKHVADLNNGVVPPLEMIALHSALIRRAAADRKRSTR